MDIADKVKLANKKFFDLAATEYEKRDPRRQDPAPWLMALLERLATVSGSGSHGTIVDAGSGTGYLIDLAKPFFKKRIAVDISSKMLDEIKDPQVEKICSDLERIPLPEASVNCITAFATLHHLFDPKLFFAQAYRILAKDGVLYTDHDISHQFADRHSSALQVYRYFFDHWKSFIKKNKSLLWSDYALSEFHGESGLNIKTLTHQLEDQGFTILEATLHWQGMGFWETWGPKMGLQAPLIRIIAQKKETTHAH